MSDMDILFNLYVEETREHLEKISEHLLKLEKEPRDEDYINTLFRSVHTIKGATFTMGYQKTGEMIHKMEDIMSLARAGKVVLDGKTIQLMFLCHDYLESFLEAVIDGKNEEKLEMGHIYEALCDILANSKDYDIPKNEQKLQKAKTVIKEMTFSKEELLNLENLEKQWKQIFVMYFKFLEDCAFPEVNSWMIINKIIGSSEYVKSIPERPTEQEFRDGFFKLSEGEMTIILATENSAEMFRDKLRDVMNEIDIVYIDPLELKKGKLVGKYLLFNEISNGYVFDTKKLLAAGSNDLTDSINDDTVIDKRYDDLFMNEIQLKVKKSEIAFLDVKYNPDNEKNVKTLYKVLHTIEGMSGFIGWIDMNDLAKDTAILLEGNFRDRGKIDDIVLEMVLKSINYIKKLSEEIVIKDQRLSSEVDVHKHVIKSSVIDYFEQINRDLEPIVEDSYMGKRLGEILIEKGKLDAGDIDNMVELQKSNYLGLKMGQVLVKEDMVSLEDVAQALTIQERVKNDPKSETKKLLDTFVRIPEQKVDNLVDMMGELLILQSLLKENVINGGEVLSKASVLNNVERMERILKDMQGISMSLRMVSLKQSFQKILRIGRDTSRELKKEVDFEIIGEETEIDRSVVEKIQDPLMHLVRNSISHGIEDSDRRRELGKKPGGIVEIKAYNKKGNVYIEINDDGKGLDTEMILQKAIEKGIAYKNKNYSESEIISFIFLPGFSTVENVNNISGRGVGMNVVDTEIRRIGGKIEVKNEFGKGCSFILKIPVNLATINGTVIDIVGQRYIIPTISVKQIFKPTREQMIKIKGKIQSIKNREDIINIIPLKSFMGIDFDESMLYESIIIVLEYDGVLRALPAKTVLGKQEVVIKPLSSEFQHLKYISGATILGDGKVSLILDVEALFGVSGVEYESEIEHKELVGV